MRDIPWCLLREVAADALDDESHSDSTAISVLARSLTQVGSTALPGEHALGAIGRLRRDVCHVCEIERLTRRRLLLLCLASKLFERRQERIQLRAGVSRSVSRPFRALYGSRRIRRTAYHGTIATLGAAESRDGIGAGLQGSRPLLGRELRAGCVEGQCRSGLQTEDAIQRTRRAAEMLAQQEAHLLERRGGSVERDRRQACSERLEAAREADAEIAVACETIELGQLVGVRQQRVDDALHHTLESQGLGVRARLCWRLTGRGSSMTADGLDVRRHSVRSGVETRPAGRLRRCHQAREHELVGREQREREAGHLECRHESADDHGRDLDAELRASE